MNTEKIILLLKILITVKIFVQNEFANNKKFLLSCYRYKIYRKYTKSR